MIETFVSIFSRMVIGLVFILSFMGKVRDISSFQKAINNFKLTPEWASPFLALLFLVGEFSVTLAMIVGGHFLSWGFILAGLMLLAFSISLLSVIVRKIDTSCNCFGYSKNDRVSSYEIYRNVCLILCTLIGYFIPVPERIHFSSLIYVLPILSALIFVIFILNLKTVIELFMFN